jgi:hypothetical protein
MTHREPRPSANEITCRFILDRLERRVFVSGSRAADDCSCGVCLDAFEVDEALAILPCQHTFHWQCLEKWICGGVGAAFRCPLCRFDLNLWATTTVIDEVHVAMGMQ